MSKQKYKSPKIKVANKKVYNKYKVKNVKEKNLKLKIKKLKKNKEKNKLDKSKIAKLVGNATRKKLKKSAVKLKDNTKHKLEKIDNIESDSINKSISTAEATVKTVKGTVKLYKTVKSLKKVYKKSKGDEKGNCKNKKTKYKKNRKSKNVKVKKSSIKGKIARGIKNQVKYRLERGNVRAKNKLKDIDNIESNTIHKSVNSAEKVIKTVRGTVKFYKVVKSLKKTNDTSDGMNSKLKYKIKKGTVKGKIKQRINKDKYKLKKSDNVSNNKASIKLKKDLHKKRVVNCKNKITKLEKINNEKPKISNSKINNSNTSKNYSKYIKDKKRKRFEREQANKNLNKYIEPKIDAVKIKENYKSNKNNYSAKEKNKKENINKNKKLKNDKKNSYATNKKSNTSNTKRGLKNKKIRKKVNSKKILDKSKNLANIIVREMTKTTYFVMKSIIFNPIGLLIIGIAFFLFLTFIMLSSLISIGGNAPNTDSDTLAYLVKHISSLDDKANYYIDNIEIEENIICDEVKYIYNSPKSFVYSSPKEFIVLLMVMTENELSTESTLILNEIHEKSYKIETDIVYEFDEDLEEEIEILEVTLTNYTFNEMFDILDFKDEQKELANEIMQLPFDKIYEEINFNEVGDGLTEEEIAELLENLPSSTYEREKLRETAFTLVNYTVYEWGGKARASIDRPTGLDCSGFVAWAYEKAGITNELQGGGTYYQWGITTPINYSELKVGDLGFLQDPKLLGTQQYNHVGIYIGNGLWVESYSGHGVGITSGNVFKYYRKVDSLN